jgi:hypothetical protein
MAERTCSIDGCDRRLKARGLCAPHYKRLKVAGDPGEAVIRSNGRTPQVKTCAIEGCQRRYSGRGYCHMHLYRLRMNGDPLTTRSPGSLSGKDNPVWRGDDVEYQAVHRRLRVYRGRAAEQACAHCGQQANEWAYQHTASDERVCPKAGLPFTTDLEHYMPMCRDCHRQLDALHGWTHLTRFGRGVSLDKQTNRWRAYAVLDGKQYSGGRYASEAEAEVAAAELRARLLAAR